jgi:hypothetical protein
MLPTGLSPAIASARIVDVIRRAQLRNAVFRPIRALGRRPIVRICGLVANNANADLTRFRRDLDRARAVWGQCGIEFVEGGFTRIHAGGDYPNWVNYTAAPEELLRQRGTCGPTDVRLYYVRSIAGSTFQGRSAFSAGEPGYVAVGDNAHPNLIPHELGHLFLGGNEEHRDSASPADMVNIMRSDVGSITGPPQVDQGQCARARATVRGGRFTGGAGQGHSGPTQAFGTSLTARDVLAVAALGQLGGMAAQMRLIGALRDPEAMVRGAALRALAAIGSPIARASIIEQVRMEPDPNVRALAYGLAMGLR